MLVITIIVILILAGVTVATLTGENGLLARAQLAKEKTAEAKQDEKDKLSSYENELNDYETYERTGNWNSQLFVDYSRLLKKEENKSESFEYKATENCYIIAFGRPNGSDTGWVTKIDNSEELAYIWNGTEYSSQSYYLEKDSTIKFIGTGSGILMYTRVYGLK